MTESAASIDGEASIDVEEVDRCQRCEVEAAMMELDSDGCNRRRSEWVSSSEGTAVFGGGGLCNGRRRARARRS